MSHSMAFVVAFKAEYRVKSDENENLIKRIYIVSLSVREAIDNKDILQSYNMELILDNKWWRVKRDFCI